MSSRVEKLNSEFRKNIYEILTKKVKDPRITEMFTILEVSCDSELTLAKVYVSVFSADQNRAKATFQAIKENAPYVRSILSKNMHIRTVPELMFVDDDTLEHGQKIDKMLNEILPKSDN